MKDQTEEAPSPSGLGEQEASFDVQAPSEVTWMPEIPRTGSSSPQALVQ